MTTFAIQAEELRPDIAQEIATAHGGQISATSLSDPENGAAFIITLPVNGGTAPDGGSEVTYG